MWRVMLGDALTSAADPVTPTGRDHQHTPLFPLVSSPLSPRQAAVDDVGAGREDTVFGSLLIAERELPPPPSAETSSASTIAAVPLRCARAADELRRLARLHDRPPTARLLEELRRRPLRDRFPGLGERHDAAQALALVDELLGDLPSPIDAASLAELADDFAAIHRNGRYRVLPYESRWNLKESRSCERVVRRLKAWHRRYRLPLHGAHAPDHLSQELRLLAGLMTHNRPEAAAVFLDRHALRWIPDFCGTVAARCQAPFFAGVAMITGAYLDHLRQQIETACSGDRTAS